jgi:hypothetical protein
MASSTRSESLRQREEERRLNLRTLVIASGASALAAAVTSQLWIHGTWIAAALTPALVALISEAMHRPTERIARAWTSERPALDPRAAPAGAPPPPHGDPLAQEVAPPAPPHGDPLAQEVAPPEAAAAGPVRVYRQRSARVPRRRIAIGVVAATAAIAFVVGIFTLTAADLVSGGSIGKGGSRTTLLGGGGGGEPAQQDAAPKNDAPEQATETTEEPPASTETTTEPQPTETAPLPPTITEPGAPAPDAQP